MSAIRRDRRDCIVGEKTLHRLRRANRRPGEDQRHGLHLHRRDDRGRRDDRAGTIFTNDRFPRATTPDLRDAAHLRTRRAHAAHARARRRDHRRRLRHRLRPRDRALRHGRHGLGRDAVHPRLPSRRGQSGPQYRRYLQVRRAGTSLHRRCNSWAAQRRNVLGMRTCVPHRGRPRERARACARLSHAVLHTQRQTWAIIGGGFLGMTLALRLARAGRAVTLFESAPALRWSRRSLAARRRRLGPALPCHAAVRSQPTGAARRARP